MNRNEIDKLLQSWGIKLEVNRMCMIDAIEYYAERENKKSLRGMYQWIGGRNERNSKQVAGILARSVEKISLSKQETARVLFEDKKHESWSIVLFLESFYKTYLFPEILEEGLFKLVNILEQNEKT